MSNSKRKVILNTVAINLGCNCRRIKLSSIFKPKPKSKPPKYQKYHNYTYSNSSTTSYHNGCYSTNSSFPPYTTSTTTSFSSSASERSLSVAVEKDSSDPYVDFRQSMLQMIVEYEIYSKDDLKQLLNCFLQLNSSSLHGIIIRVFTEIWNSFFYSGRPDYASRFYVHTKTYQI